MKTKNEKIDTGMEIFKAGGSEMVNYAKTEKVSIPKVSKGFKEARAKGAAIGGVKFTER